MSKSFTYKQNFFGIVVLFVVLIFACYKKTYKHIFEAKIQLNLVESKLNKANNSYNEVYMLKNEIRNLDNIIGGQSKTPEQVQQRILEFVSDYHDNIKISSIEDTHIINEDEFRIYTNSIEVEGSYFDLIPLMYNIEQEFKVSRVVSAKLFSIKNYRTNSKLLYLKLIFQNYEKSN